MAKLLREAEIRPVPGEPYLVTLHFPSMTMLVTLEFVEDIKAAFAGDLKEPLPAIAEEVYVACRGEDKDMAHSLVFAFSAAKSKLYPPPEQLELFEVQVSLTPSETTIQNIYDEAVEELIEDPKAFITKMKTGIELQREILYGRRIRMDGAGFILWLSGWGLLAYQWTSSWGEFDWAKWAIGAFLLLFAKKIITK